MLNRRQAAEGDILSFAADTYATATIAAMVPEFRRSMIIGSQATTIWSTEVGDYDLHIWNQAYDTDGLVQEIDNPSGVTVTLRKTGADSLLQSFSLKTVVEDIAPSHNDTEAVAATTMLRVLGLRNFAELLPAVQDLTTYRDVRRESIHTAYIVTTDAPPHLRLPRLSIIAEESDSASRPPVRSLHYEDDRHCLEANFSRDEKQLRSHRYSILKTLGPYGELSDDILIMMMDYSSVAMDAITSIIQHGTNGGTDRKG